MHKLLMLLLLAGLATAGIAHAGDSNNAPIAIAVHGGAGTITRADLSDEKETGIHAALQSALKAGHRILAAGGSSVDAVAAAVRVLEDSPHFNAGKGAVFNCAGENEMDAAIMNGADLAAGAVAGLKHVRNPVDMARLVMEKSPHVLLVGEGAESFGRQHGIRMVDAEYFQTEFRRQQLREVQQRDGKQGCGDGTGEVKGFDVTAYGTVGAVALDKQGNLAAATSTGGMTNKRFGRVGDVPIIGAGTYADNRTAAISATGHGEYFMRTVAAHSIVSRMAYKQESLAAAADAVIMGTLKDMGGGGGVIAVDGRGTIVMTFNTTGMYRGAIGVDGKLMTAIYRE